VTQCVCIVAAKFEFRRRNLRLSGRAKLPVLPAEYRSRPQVVELHASRAGERNTYVMFIYEKDSGRLLRHIVGTDENEVIDQALAWSESNPRPIDPEAVDRLQRASADERSAEFELFQKLLNGSAIDEIVGSIEKFCEARQSANELWQRYLFGIALRK
jgi:hypothetical protein